MNEILGTCITLWFAIGFQFISDDQGVLLNPLLLGICVDDTNGNSIYRGMLMNQKTAQSLNQLSSTAIFKTIRGNQQNGMVALAT